MRCPLAANGFVSPGVRNLLSLLLVQPQGPFPEVVLRPKSLCSSDFLPTADTRHGHRALTWQRRAGFYLLAAVQTPGQVTQGLFEGPVLCFDHSHNQRTPNMPSRKASLGEASKTSSITKTKSLAWFYQKLCVFQHTKRWLYTGRIIHIPPASPHWELANSPVHLGSSRATIGASPSSGSSIPSRLRHGAGTEHFQAHLTPLDEMLRFQHPRPKKKKLSPATPSSSVAIFEVHRLNCRRLQTHLLSFCSAIWHLCIRRRLHICQMGKNIFSCNSCRNGEGGGI